MPVAPMSSVKTGTLGAIVSFVKCRCALLRCRFAPISAAGGGAYFNTLPCPNALLLIKVNGETSGLEPGDESEHLVPPFVFKCVVCDLHIVLHCGIIMA